MRVSKEFHFCYGHRLLHHKGKCRNLHGHNGIAVVTVEGEPDPSTSMVLDFGEMHFVREYIDQYWDHRLLLNSADPLCDKLGGDLRLAIFGGREPTAETMADDLLLLVLTEFRKMAGKWACSVRIYETPTCWVETAMTPV